MIENIYYKRFLQIGDKRMHIAKELLYNVSSSNLNRFLSEHDIKNEQKMRYADHRVMLELGRRII